MKSDVLPLPVIARGTGASVASAFVASRFPEHAHWVMLGAAAGGALEACLAILRDRAAARRQRDLLGVIADANKDRAAEIAERMLGGRDDE